MCVCVSTPVTFFDTTSFSSPAPRQKGGLDASQMCANVCVSGWKQRFIYVKKGVCVRACVRLC